MARHGVAWLFPGQGSQTVGMGWDLCRKVPVAAEILGIAEDLSGAPLKEICWRGPEELLSRTEILQPALTAVSLGCVELLRDAGDTPDAVAGHSLGEFAALYAAEVLSLEETLRLVTARGRLMAVAAAEEPGGMVAVKRLDAARVEAVVRELGPGRRVVVANSNAPTQTVLSGSIAALATATELIRVRGGEVVPLRVSGAWHSPLMEGAAAAFRQQVAAAEFRPAQIPVYLNTGGAAETDPDRIRAAMADQMVQPVRWCSIIETMFDDGIRDYWEVGPGKVLRGLLRQILPDERSYAVRGIDGPRSLARRVAVSPGRPR